MRLTVRCFTAVDMNACAYMFCFCISFVYYAVINMVGLNGNGNVSAKIKSVRIFCLKNASFC